MAKKGKKAAKKATRVRKQAKKAARAGRSVAKKRVVRKPSAKKPTSPRKTPPAKPPAAELALAGEMYGEADWKADEEQGQGFQELSHEKPMARKTARERMAAGDTPKVDEESEW